MKKPSADSVRSFVIGAGAVGATAFASQACPGTCTACSSCVASLTPLAAALGAIGLAAVARKLPRMRRGDPSS